MILYTSKALGASSDWKLLELLRHDPLTFLQGYDVPVAGTQIKELGVLGRALVGTLVNQPNRPWGLLTALA